MENMENRLKSDLQNIYENLGKSDVTPTVTRSWGHRVVNIGGNNCRLDKVIKKLETEINKCRSNTDEEKNDLLTKIKTLQDLNTQSKKSINFLDSKTGRLKDILATLRGEGKTPKIKIESHKKFEELKKQKIPTVRTAEVMERTTICARVPVGQCELRLWEGKIILLQNKNHYEKNIYLLDSSENNGIELRKLDKDLTPMELHTHVTFEGMFAALGSSLSRSQTFKVLQ